MTSLLSCFFFQIVHSHSALRLALGQTKLNGLRQRNLDVIIALCKRSVICMLVAGFVCMRPRNVNQFYTGRSTLTMESKQDNHHYSIDCVCTCVLGEEPCINKYYFFSPHILSLQCGFTFHLMLNGSLHWVATYFSYYGVIVHFVKICLLDKKSDRSCLWRDH